MIKHKLFVVFHGGKIIKQKLFVVFHGVYVGNY